MIRIAPSIMCADLLRLGEEVRALEDGGADSIHVDIMDGHFVPGFTFGADFVSQLCRSTHLPVDVHLMSDRPIEHLAEFLDLDVALVCIHTEATPDLYRGLEIIRRAGRRAGVALNPATDPSVVDGVLHLIDAVNVMTVCPGFVGQPLLASCLDKAAALVESLGRSGHPQIEVAVDGGVKISNIEEIAARGIHKAISGTGIFGRPDRAAAVAEMRERASSHATLSRETRAGSTKNAEIATLRRR